MVDVPEPGLRSFAAAGVDIGLEFCLPGDPVRPLVGISGSSRFSTCSALYQVESCFLFFFFSYSFKKVLFNSVPQLL